MIDIKICVDGKVIAEILNQMPNWAELQKQQRVRDERRKLMLDIAYDRIARGDVEEPKE